MDLEALHNNRVGYNRLKVAITANLLSMAACVCAIFMVELLPEQNETPAPSALIIFSTMMDFIVLIYQINAGKYFSDAAPAQPAISSDSEHLREEIKTTSIFYNSFGIINGIGAFLLLILAVDRSKYHLAGLPLGFSILGKGTVASLHLYARANFFKHITYAEQEEQLQEVITDETTPLVPASN